MTITCIALIGERKLNPKSLLGKRKLIECKLLMDQVGDSFLWECPLRHKRQWPAQESIRRSDPLKIQAVLH